MFPHIVFEVVDGCGGAGGNKKDEGDRCGKQDQPRLVANEILDVAGYGILFLLNRLHTFFGSNEGNEEAKNGYEADSHECKLPSAFFVFCSVPIESSFGNRSQVQRRITLRRECLKVCTFVYQNLDFLKIADEHRYMKW